MPKTTISRNPFISLAAALLTYFLGFILWGSVLSHTLFLWMGQTCTAALSHTILCGCFAVFAILVVFIPFLLECNCLEGALIGFMLSVSAGGFYCSPYFSLVICLVEIAVFFVVFMLFHCSFPRVIYLALCFGLAHSLGMYLYQYYTIAEISNLTTASSTVKSVSLAEWGQYSASQRQAFLCNVVRSEEERLGVGENEIIECILPEEVASTVDLQGRILINYADLRVASVSSGDVENKNSENDSWSFERLTSPKDMVKSVCHAVAHVYQQKRVAGLLSEQANWPYDDASNSSDGNAVLEEWKSELPINPMVDKVSSHNKLESQAWSYASTRVDSYLKK